MVEVPPTARQKVADATAVANHATGAAAGDSPTAPMTVVEVPSTVAQSSTPAAASSLPASGTTPSEQDQLMHDAGGGGAETSQSRRRPADTPIEDLDPRTTSYQDAMNAVEHHFSSCGMPGSKVELEEVVQALNKLGASYPDVAEVFSPPRCTALAPSFYLTPGFAIDVLENKPGSDSNWDLLKKEDRALALEMLKQDKPFLLVGSPPCASFSALNRRLNYPAMDPMAVGSKVKEGKILLQAAVDMYKVQLEEGRVFLHEHPVSAASWEEPCIKQLMQDPRVFAVRTELCEAGYFAADGRGVGLIRGEGQWLTNSPHIARQLDSLKCSNVTAEARGHVPHRHVPLMCQRAGKKAVYSPAIVARILTGLIHHLNEEGSLSIAALDVGPVNEEPVVAAPQTPAEEEELEVYVDDVHGVLLDTKMVREARAEELRWMFEHGTFEVVPRQSAAGHRLVKTLWVDTNKGDDARPDYRSRLCARETRRSGGLEGLEAQLFAATPPLEALRAILSLAMSRRCSRRGGRLKLGFIDIKKAHLFGKVKRKIFIELPAEAGVSSDFVGELKYSLYGTRDAAANFERTYTEVLVNHGFVQGVSNPCLFHHLEWDVAMMVHGDDFVVCADQDAILATTEALQTKFELKLRAALGDGGAAAGASPAAPWVEQQEVRILNRIVRWKADAQEIEYEADPRHAELAIAALGLQAGKGVSSPATKVSAEELERGSTLLSREQAKVYRSVAMRLQYLAQDRPDIQFPCKERARFMSQPAERDLVALKRIARYLISHPRLIWSFALQQLPKKVVVYADSDHAGCLLTRKSTTGIAMMLGKHCIRTNSNTQADLSLSSGEAEFYGAI